MSNTKWLQHRVQYTNSSGPIVSSVQFYDTGTTTPITTYSDKARTTANANPLNSASNGIFGPVFFDPDDLVTGIRVIIYDAAGGAAGSGSVLFDDDPYGSILTQADVGKILYPRTTAETAASVTPTNYFYEPGNILRYGASPAGVVDSYAAVGNAIAAHPEKVYIPAGTYIDSNGPSSHARTIASASGFSMRGDGAGNSILKQFHFDFTVTGSDITIQGLSFIDHNWALTFYQCSDVKISNIYTRGRNTGTGNRAIILKGCNRVTIDSCTFRKHQNGVYLDQDSTGDMNRDITCSNSIFENVENTTGPWPVGFYLRSASDVLVSGCTFRDYPNITYDSAPTSGYGIYQGDNTSSDDARCENYTFTGNVFKNIDESAVAIHNAHNVSIIGNTVVGATADHRLARAFWIFGDTDPKDSSVQDLITIIGNTVQGGGRIQIGGGTGSVQQVVISGNVIDNSESQGIRCDSGTDYLTISNNHIKNTDQTGIYLSTVNYVSVTGNTVIDTNQDAEAAGNTEHNACLRMNSCTDSLVTGNRFMNIAANGAHYGISLNSNAQRHVYDRTNHFVNMRTANILGAFTAAPTAGTWEIGDFVPRMSSLTKDGNNMVHTGWICVAQGAPGTWEDQYVSDISPAT
jgi:hypothetical protein